MNQFQRFSKDISTPAASVPDYFMPALDYLAGLSDYLKEKIADAVYPPVKGEEKVMFGGYELTLDDGDYWLTFCGMEGQRLLIGDVTPYAIWKIGEVMDIDPEIALLEGVGQLVVWQPTPSYNRLMAKAGWVITHYAGGNVVFDAVR